MSEPNLHDELDRLRSQVADLEHHRTASEAAAREQSTQLEQSVAELHRRAEELSRAEEALRRQACVLQSVLDGIGDGVAVTDENGTFLLFNAAARQMLRLSPAAEPTPPPTQWPQHYGLFLPDQVTPYPAEAMPLARALRGEEVTCADVFLRPANAPDGSWLSVTARPLHDERGALHGGVSVFRDVTDRRRAEENLRQAERHYRMLLDSTSEGVYGLDREGRCTFINRAAAALLGYAPDDLLGRQPHSLFHAGPSNGATAETCPVCRAYLSGESCRLRETAFRRRDGTTFPIEYTAVPVAEGEALCGTVISFNDITERKRSEDELRKSRERFELAMQASGAGIWDWDIDSDQVYVSPQWKRMLGYEDHELPIARGEWESRLHPEDREQALATLRDYYEGRVRTYESEYRLRHRDGSYRWIHGRALAVRDSAGKPCRMAGSQTDITARKQAEVALRDSEALYHSLVETLPLCVFRKDRLGRFNFGNQRFLATLGRPLAEVLNKTDYDFYPPELAAKYQQDDLKVLATGQVFDDVEQHRSPGGERIYVQVVKAPVFDSRGAIVGTEAIFWDVTARKLAEEAMQQAKEAAEAASRAKSQFLANMSHEIRTPLNAVVGMTELVLGTPLNDEQRDCLETVRKSADALLAVINDILDFSKIEAGKLELDLHDFCLRDSVGDVLSTLALRASQKGLELACHIAPEVPDALVGDASRLGQVLTNLVGNALKFTEQGEVVVRVSVHAAAARRQVNEPEALPGLAAGLVGQFGSGADQAPAASPRCLPITLSFEVCDTGVGIPQEKCETIFAPFVQADGSTTRKYGGTGLGLAISARLVEMMEGRLRVESVPGRGSIFRFTAQFGVRTEAPQFPTPLEAERVRGLSVLVVDDNATNRRILEETLLHWGLRPTTTESGSAALSVLRRASESGEPFPLVLLDAHMPEMSGFMLAEQIKGHPDLTGAAVMMLTSGDQPGDVAHCRQLGLSAYLVKPVKQVDLWRALLAALGTPAAVPAAVPVPAPADNRRLNVLLVEDNPVNQKLAVRLLERRGHAVTVAGNGRLALQALDGRTFDVVLMDIQMPEMDGYETTACIRQREQPGGRRQPIIAMTAYAMKGDQERCLRAGMDDYVAKPFRAQELFAKLEGLAGTAPSAAPAPPHSAPAAPEALDWEAALEYVAGDRPLLRELVGVFLEECPRWTAELSAALAARDAPPAVRAAHKLKGTLGHFGARAAFASTRQLENQCRAADWTAALETWGPLEKEIECLLPALVEWSRSNE